MTDREKVIKGLECCKTEDCSNCPYVDTSAPIGKFGTDELISCQPVLYDNCISLLKEQDKIIAALQCALDKANEKLAYVSGEKCYHYDCEAGREQLEAWWAAVKHEEQEPIKPLITGHGEFEGSWWYECGNCGTPIDPDDKFCRKCGMEIKWHD